MNHSSVTKNGITESRPDREATTGVVAGRPAGRAPRRAGGTEAVVPGASFESYYGKPVINPPVWSSPDIPGYLFLGGLAGASSVMAAAAQLSGRGHLASVGKLGSAGAAGLSLVALVHDLGRPGRFLNMLRVFKPTSPMSVGSWLLAGYAPAAAAAAGSQVTGVLPAVGSLSTAAAALLGPAVASYTAALVSDTAVPAWHDAHKEMPFLFVSSGAAAAGGLGLVGASLVENEPARRFGVFGGALELSLEKLMERRLHPKVAAAYHEGKAGSYMRAAEVLTAAGVLGAALTGRRSRLGAALSGAALLAGSACTRFGIFHAGERSSLEPEATIAPQRERLPKDS